MKIKLVLISIATLIIGLSLPQAIAKSGLMDFDGHFIVPPEYNSIVRTSKNRYILFKDKPKARPRGMIAYRHSSIYYREALKTAILVDENGKQIGTSEDLHEEAVKRGLAKRKPDTEQRRVYGYGKFQVVTNRKTGLSGVEDKSGKQILPEKFGRIRQLGDGMFLVTEEKSVKPTNKQFLYCKSKLVKEVPGWVIPRGQFYNDVVRIGARKDAVLTKRGDIKYGVKDTRFSHVPKYPVKIKQSGLSIVKIDRAKPLRALYGIKDRSGKYVIPAQYDYIKQRKDGLFRLSKDMNVSIYDGDSKQLIVFPETVKTVGKVPKGKDKLIPCSFSSIPGSFDSGSYSLWGFCDHDGKIVIEPKYNYLIEIDDTRFLAAINGRSGPDSRCGIIDGQGNWIVKPEYNRLYKVDENRLVAILPEHDSLSQRWKSKLDSKTFSLLLNKYNFIGMSVGELEAVLGESNLRRYNRQPAAKPQKLVRYIMSGGGCTGSPVLSFQLDSKRAVTGWCVHWSGGGFGRALNWVRENVGVVDTRKRRLPGNMVPKEDLAAARKALGLKNNI